MVSPPALDLEHRLLLAASRRGEDAHELTERAILLTAAALEQADPRRVDAGRPATLRTRQSLADASHEALAADPDRSLPELAADLGVSAHHLSRIFRAAAGHALAPPDAATRPHRPRAPSRRRAHPRAAGRRSRLRRSKPPLPRHPQRDGAHAFRPASRARLSGLHQRRCERLIPGNQGRGPAPRSAIAWQARVHRLPYAPRLAVGGRGPAGAGSVGNGRVSAKQAHGEARVATQLATRAGVDERCPV